MRSRVGVSPRDSCLQVLSLFVAHRDEDGGPRQLSRQGKASSLPTRQMILKRYQV